MKKIYILTASCLITLAGYAQNAPSAETKKKNNQSEIIGTEPKAPTEVVYNHSGSKREEKRRLRESKKRKALLARRENEIARTSGLAANTDKAWHPSSANRPLSVRFSIMAVLHNASF
jgi:predicted TIM-barrel fold metal-dependent hydrolase